jgi:flagellar assembly protein FliH
MSKPPFRNVPPPPGSKPASAYTRFIPREELHEFAAWNPGSFGDDAQAQPQAPEPEPSAPPTDAEWQAQVQAARQAGYQDGYRDGLVALDGFKQSFAAQMSAQVGHLVEELDAQFLALETQMAAAVADTAARLARQVLRSELATDPSLIARVAAEAVETVLLSARQITLHVHPQDLPLVAEGAAESLQARGARLVADASLERGGCRVESDLGAVDARIGERWAQAAAALGADVPWSDEEPEA